MIYSHTQRGPGPWFVAALGVLVLALASLGGWLTLVFVAAGVVPAMVIVVALSTMTVEVTAETVKVTYRFGWPSRTVKRANVAGHGQVRNRWWYGLGIRLIPGGNLWSVWGLDAVELRMADDASESFFFADRPGKVFRIGTDDPEGLDRALDG